MTLLDGQQLRLTLEKHLKQSSKSVLIISAYVTQTAVDWLEKNIKPDTNVSIICRLNPEDIINGSTNISALRSALNNNWKVSCLHSLHAKIYLIDRSHMYVGSANLTSNGLRIYGKGNLEACTEVTVDNDSIDFIQKIEKSSTIIDENALNKMEQFLDQNKFNPSIISWPNDVISASEGLWVQDMFWCNLSDTEHSDANIIHDLDILRLEQFNPKSKEFTDRVSNSRAILWLTDLIKKDDKQELYFGSITKALHDELSDDPAPYRQDVKKLVQNLLSYCEVCLPNKFEILRPNYSQKIKFIEKD